MRKLKTIEMGRLTVEQFKAAGKLPLVVVLDNVRSLYNVGSVFRSCDAFRIERICLCGITACPPHAEIHKTALGAEDSVQWQYFATATAAVEQLHREGYTVMAVEQCEGSTMLHHFVPDTGRRYAVVLGNEVKGVAQEVVNMADGCLEIPQFGTLPHTPCTPLPQTTIFQQTTSITTLHYEKIHDIGFGGHCHPHRHRTNL